MLKGIFLDLDGTLVDTHRSNCEAYLQAIQEVMGEGKVDRAALLARICKGGSHEAFLRELIADITDQEVCSVAKRKAEIYPKLLDHSRLNEGLLSDVVRARDASGALVVLVTTAKEVNARNVLRYHGVESLFDYAVFGDGVACLKPDPEIYLKALEITGLDPHEVIAYEDSNAGVESASKAGVRVIKVDWCPE